MSPPERIIGLRELLEAYLESCRLQRHEILADHYKRTVAAFEAALDVRIPKERSDVPRQWHSLFNLFHSIIESVLSVRTPLSDYLEAGLIFRRLEEAGAEGKVIKGFLYQAEDTACSLVEVQMEILEGLLRIFIGGIQPSVSMDTIRATGLYPGDAPKDFDVFDHT